MFSNGNGRIDSLQPASFVRAAAASRKTRDPALDIAGMPPNYGRDAVPHVISFTGVMGNLAKVYRVSDEAMQASRENARYMRHDLSIMECLEARKRSVCLLDWHLQPEDEQDPKQKQLCDDLTAVINRTPNFLKMREWLMEALWFGRSAVQTAGTWDTIGGRRQVRVKTWKPIHGDKLVWRYDDGSGQYDPDQVGIRVGAGAIANTRLDTSKIQPTDWGQAYFLDAYERDLLTIHKHQIEDGEFEDPASAGRIHGLGIRDRIYWTWFQARECLAWMMEFLERSAFGLELWYFPLGNAEAEAKLRTAAQERIGDGRNIILVPRPIDGQNLYGVEKIEANMAGADVLKSVITEYFGHAIKRYILGQTLTTEAAGTGLGSNLASIHLDTYLQIVKYDSINLSETLTEDFVRPLLRWNFPKYRDLFVRFVIDTQAPDVESKLKAWYQAWQMGLKLKASDLMDLIGAARPEGDDEVLENPQIAAAQQQAQQQQQGAAPGQPAQAPGWSPEEKARLAAEAYEKLLEVQLADALGENGPANGASPPYENSERRRLAYAAGAGCQLAKGTAVEMEHTDDPEVARQIASDHLRENPDYYRDFDPEGEGREKLVRYRRNWREELHPRDEDGTFTRAERQALGHAKVGRRGGGGGRSSQPSFGEWHKSMFGNPAEEWKAKTPEAERPASLAGQRGLFGDEFTVRTAKEVTERAASQGGNEYQTDAIARWMKENPTAEPEWLQVRTKSGTYVLAKHRGTGKLKGQDVFTAFLMDGRAIDPRPWPANPARAFAHPPAGLFEEWSVPEEKPYHGPSWPLVRKHALQVYEAAYGTADPSLIEHLQMVHDYMRELDQTAEYFLVTTAGHDRTGANYEMQFVAKYKDPDGRPVYARASQRGMTPAIAWPESEQDRKRMWGERHWVKPIELPEPPKQPAGPSADPKPAPEGQLERPPETDKRGNRMMFERDRAAVQRFNLAVCGAPELYRHKPAAGQRSLFREEDHPRADDGTFAEKEGGGGGAAEAEEDERQRSERAKSKARQQWKDFGVQSPVFKAWFGDWEHDRENASKVVDKDGQPQQTHSIPGSGSRVKGPDGKPKRVYHGTPKGGWHAFDESKLAPAEDLLFGTGFYFTEDAGIARDYEQRSETEVKWKADKAEAATELRKRLRVKADEATAPYKRAAADFGPGDDEPWDKYPPNVHLLASMAYTMSDDDLLKLVQYQVAGGLDPAAPGNNPFFGGVQLDDLVGMARETKEVYLNIRNPIDMDRKIQEDELKALTKKIKALDPQWLAQFEGTVRPVGATSPEQTAAANRDDIVSQLETAAWHGGTTGERIWKRLRTAFGAAATTPILKKLGYDGITHIGGIRVGHREHIVWIAFDPGQIKSVDNEGTFDANNPDIRYAAGRELYRYKSAPGQRSMFREEDHPRADDGTFAEKDGGGAAHATKDGPRPAKQPAKPDDDGPTDEEQAKYAEYEAAMLEHNLPPRPVDEWLKHLREHQAKRRAAGDAAQPTPAATVEAKPGDYLRFKGHKNAYEVVGPGRDGKGYTIRHPQHGLLAMSADPSVVEIAPKPAPEPKRSAGGRETARKVADATQRQKAAAKLRDVAATAKARAEEQIHRPRLENTRRRADMAAGIVNEALREERLADTIANLADHVESGKAVHLANLRNRAQVETLATLLRRAKDRSRRAQAKAQGLSSYDEEKLRQKPTELPDTEHAEYPYPTVHKDHIKRLLESLKGRRGLGETLQVVREIPRKNEWILEASRPRHVQALRDLVDAGNRAGVSKWDLANIKDSLRQYDHLQQLGIGDREQLVASLKEFLPLRAGSRDEPAWRKMERNLRGRKIAGFFPTPPSVIERMLGEAQIEPGHSVLEPSAGAGHILDAIRDRHPESHARGIEHSHELHKLLTAKGHEAEHGDFLAHKGQYDRILMNPPFENHQDIDHVRHAFQQLKPGGRLVAIMSSGPFQREQAKDREFRDWFEGHNGQSEPLPEGSFAGADAFRQTGVNTRLVVLEKPK